MIKLTIVHLTWESFSDVLGKAIVAKSLFALEKQKGQIELRRFVEDLSKRR